MTRDRATKKLRTQGEYVVLGEFVRTVGEHVLLRGGKVVPKIGEAVYDGEMRQVGYVADVFGPVNEFYVLVRLTSKSPKYDCWYVIR